MALEIIMGAEYNNKNDKWPLGYINHELFALNFCFNSQSYKELINNIKEYKHERINQEIYGLELQKIKDSLLNKDYNISPKIKEIIIITKEFLKNHLKKMSNNLRRKIQRNIQESIDKLVSYYYMEK